MLVGAAKSVKETVQAAAAAVVGDKSDAKAAKEKKEKKKDAGAADGKKGGGKAPAVAEDAGEPAPSMVDLRVGHIVDSESTPVVWFIYLILIFLLRS